MTDRTVEAWLRVEAARATSWLSDRRSPGDQPAPSSAPALFRDDPMRAFACMCDVRCCKDEKDEIFDSAVATAAAPPSAPPPHRGYSAASALSTRKNADGGSRSGSGRRRGGGEIYQSAAASARQPPTAQFVSPRIPAPSLLPVRPRSSAAAFS